MMTSLEKIEVILDVFLRIAVNFGPGILLIWLCYLVSKWQERREERKRRVREGRRLNAHLRRIEAKIENMEKEEASYSRWNN